MSEQILPITKVIEIHNELVSSKIQNQDEYGLKFFLQHESANMVTDYLVSPSILLLILHGTSGQIVELLKVFRIVVVGKLGNDFPHLIRGIKNVNNAISEAFDQDNIACWGATLIEPPEGTFQSFLTLEPFIPFALSP